jgi:hypothetical protein
MGTVTNSGSPGALYAFLPQPSTNKHNKACMDTIALQLTPPSKRNNALFQLFKMPM